MPGPKKSKVKSAGLFGGIVFDNQKVDLSGVTDLRPMFNLDMDAKRQAALRRLQRLGKDRRKKLY